MVPGVFLIFSTQINAQLMHLNALLYGIDRKGVLLHEYSKSVILQGPHFRRVVNQPVPLFTQIEAMVKFRTTCK